MLHPMLRRQRIVLLVVLGLLALLSGMVVPNQVAPVFAAENNTDPNTAVNSTGQSLVVPEAGGKNERPFRGTEDLSTLPSTAFTAPSETLTDLIPLGADSILGPDGRKKVKKTTRYPYRAIAFLEVTFPGNVKGSCTGWFIGPRTLATAGHCVFDQQLGWATAINVLPGKNAGTNPYGAFDACNLWSVNGWVNSASPEYDYGAIMLQASAGNTVGWFGFANLGNNKLDEKSVKNHGYPGDKPRGTQWGMGGKIKQVSTRQLFHDMDTFGGQSGSPVYEVRENGPYGLGVHAYGGTTLNGATRINKSVFNNLKTWKDNPSC